MRYYVVSGVKDLDKYKEQAKDVKGLRLLHLLPRDILSFTPSKTREIIERLVKYFNDHEIEKGKLAFAFNNDYNNALFSEEELENLKKLQEYFSPKRVVVGIYDYAYVFNYNEVKKACDYIREKVAEIKKCKYSPLEKYMHAYLDVANRYYSYEKPHDTLARSRSVYGVLNSEKIVCVGYANLLSAIVNNLGDKNLRFFANDYAMAKKSAEVDGYNGKSFVGHNDGIVCLKDDKYKVNGIFESDATWDSAEKGWLHRLTYFLNNIVCMGDMHANKNIFDIDDVETYLVRTTGNNGDDPIETKWRNYTLNKRVPGKISITPESTSLYSRDSEGNKNDFTEYLFKKQDFKDFVTLKQTELDVNDGQKFNEAFEHNYKKADVDVGNMSVVKEKEIIHEYILEHSYNVDMKTIMEALNVVLKNTESNKTKDERSEIAHKIISQSIRGACQGDLSENSNDFLKAYGKPYGE